MPSHDEVRPTLLTYIRLLFAILSGLPAAITSFLSNYHHHSQVGTWPWKRTAMVSLVKGVSKALPLSLDKEVSPTTGAVIAKAAKRDGLDHNHCTVEIKGFPNVTFHELRIPQMQHTGRRNERVLMYWYGGGFNEPIHDLGHVRFLKGVCSRAGISKIVMVETRCAPEARYPTPLAQSVAVINALLAGTHGQLGKLTPERIILAGDSAGGNVVLTLLAHSIKPHSDIPALTLAAGEAFAGAACLSPWVTFDSSAESYMADRGWDFLNHKTLAEYTRNYSPKREVWAEPLLEGATFWRKAPARRIFLSTGEWELFRDDDLTMGMILQEGLGKSRVQVVEGRAEVHCHFVLSHAEGKSYGTHKAFSAWIEGLE